MGLCSIQNLVSEEKRQKFIIPKPVRNSYNDSSIILSLSLLPFLLSPPPPLVSVCLGICYIHYFSFMLSINNLG